LNATSIHFLILKRGFDIKLAMFRRQQFYAYAAAAFTGAPAMKVVLKFPNTELP